MDKKLIIGISLIGILVLGLGAYSLNNQNTANAVIINQGAPGNAATKLTFTNNGPTWLHFDAVMENVRMKDGTTQNFYMEGWLKPNGGTLTIDLSQLLGYGNEKLPAMTLRMLEWEGLFQPTGTQPPIGGTSDMNFDIQGWSNTPQPGAGDIKYPLSFPGLPIAQLPSDVTDNKIVIATTIPEAAVLDNDADEPIFAEKLITVDPAGRVTITFPTAPTLCITAAHIV